MPLFVPILMYKSTFLIFMHVDNTIVRKFLKVYN